MGFKILFFPFISEDTQVTPGLLMLHLYFNISVGHWLKSILLAHRAHCPLTSQCFTTHTQGNFANVKGRNNPIDKKSRVSSCLTPREFGG